MRNSRAAVMGMVLAAVLWVSARGTVIEMTSLEDLASRADLIVSGEIASTAGRLTEGHIETTIHVAVRETFKGSVSSKDLVLTQLGGSIKEPIPLSQAVPGLAPFAPKEKVILFLSTAPPRVPAALQEKALASNGGKLPALWTSPKVIGGFQGKYTIYYDTKLQKEMVIRQSGLTAHGVDPSSIPPEMQARLAESGQMTHLGESPAAATPAGETEVRAPSPITAMTYEAFRTRLETLVKASEAQKQALIKPAPPPAAPAASPIPGK